MSGVKHKRKGTRIEREIVDLHEAEGIHAERIPLSGAARFRGAGHDVDVYAFGVDECPLTFEVKGRKDGDGFRMLERWLGDNDGLLLRRNRAEPLVVLPWEVWAALLVSVRKAWERGLRKELQDEIFVRRAGGVVADEAKPPRMKLTHRICPDGVVRPIEGGSDGSTQVLQTPPPVASSVPVDGPTSRKAGRVAPRKTRA